MNRRNFLTSAASATAGLAACNKISAGTDDNRYLAYRKEYAPKQKAVVIDAFANEFLSVKIYSNAKFHVEDLKNGEKWESWPLAIQDKGIVEEGHVWLNTDRSQVQQYPGRFAGEKSDKGIRFKLLGRKNLIIGSFLCRIQLEGPWLVFTTSEIDDSIPSLVFPTPLKSDAIIIPKGVGEIIREKQDGMFTRYIYPFYTRLNMRWLGGLKGDAAWIGIFDEGFEDSFGFVANRTATPVMTRSLSKWNHSYTWRLQFIRGDYVSLAKIFRKWVIDNGKFVSLSDKIKTNKNLSSFPGGRAFWINLAFPSESVSHGEDLYLSDNSSNEKAADNKVKILFTYRELKEMISKLKKLGLSKGIIKIGGWINGGYDYSHPDVWPPEPSLGEIQELKEILAEDGPILTGLHDNNQDIYEQSPSFPEGVDHNADGSLLTGGIWAGGQAYILNSRNSVEYAKRNWEKIRMLEPRAMFIDIVTAMQLYQSFDPSNQLTKKQDHEEKCNLLRFYKDQGIILGSEEAADFGIPYIDWFESRQKRTAGKSIPLWPLVFHDAAFCTRYGGVDRDTDYPGYLEDMLWGYMPHFHIEPGWNQEKLFQSLSHVDEWHERIGTAEMTNHRFLTEDFNIEESTFSTGDCIVCNFGDKPFSYYGKTVKARNYLIVYRS